MESKIFTGILKTCPACKEEKDLYWFYKNKTGKYAGVTHTYCKQCAILKKNKWNKENPEKFGAWQKKAKNKIHYGVAVDVEKTNRRREIEDRLWQRLEQ